MNVMLIWLSAAALAGGVAHAAQPVSQIAALQLRGAETSATRIGEDRTGDYSSADEERPIHAPSLPSPSSVPLVRGASQTREQAFRPELARPDNASVSVAEAPGIWDGHGGAANAIMQAPGGLRSNGAANVDFLRGRSSEVSRPESIEALRQSAFGDVRKSMYTLPSADGRVALTGMAAHAVGPLAHHRKSRELPVTEISVAAIALLAFILGRNFLAATRREKARRSRVR